MSNHVESKPDDSILIRVKAVPGASRDSIAGLLGDRLKVRVSAAPEGGKANNAICKIIAKSLKLKAAQVEIHAGHTNPEKTIQIRGCSIEQMNAAFTIDAGVIVMGSQ